MPLGNGNHVFFIALERASNGNLPHDENFGDQVMLTQIGIQATLRYTVFPWQPTIATYIVASSVFTWVRLKAVKEMTQCSCSLPYASAIICDDSERFILQNTKVYVHTFCSQYVTNNQSTETNKQMIVTSMLKMMELALK
jgi:hypothetical protein